MRIVTLSAGVPDLSIGGGGNYSCLIRHFLGAGHEVTHVGVVGKHEETAQTPSSAPRPTEMGVEVIRIPYQIPPPVAKGLWSRLRQLISPRLADYFPNEVATSPLVLATLERLKPDCVVAFAFDAAIYASDAQCPKVSIQAEGPHINQRVNWRYDPQVAPSLSPAYIFYTLKQHLVAAALERCAVDVTRPFSLTGFQGPHYVDWAWRKGLENAVFIHTPIPDTPFGADWARHRKPGPGPTGKTRILMIGHLHSTSNRSGLPIFFEKILPTLERELGTDRFEVHIVGRNEKMPHRFDAYRAHPALVWRGPVFPPHDEFLAADILLVPIPAKTGLRCRIINGFSYGCCVVAHRANALGIPELEHEKNILLGDDGMGIAREVMRAVRDPDLRRRLGEDGRATYEKAYTEELGGKAVMALVEKSVAMPPQPRPTRPEESERS